MSRTTWMAFWTLLLVTPAASYGQGELHRFTGANPDDLYGFAASGSGDVNSDGFDDLIIGAYNDDTNGMNAGMAELRSGLDGSVLWTALGTTGDWFGRSVGVAADVDGDGIPDVIVGAPFQDLGGLGDAGSAGALRGHDGGLIWAFNGSSAGDLLGFSVGGAGDVNLDGYFDLIVGAPGDDDNGSDSGSAFVYSGRTGVHLYQFKGGMPGDEFGYAVGGAGDVDADGHDDLIVGAPSSDVPANGAGSAAVLSGLNGALIHVFLGAQADDGLGLAVAGAGDVNLDSFEDVLVGSPFNDDGGSDAGRATLYSGQNGLPMHSMTGESANDLLGIAVSGAGDVNDDAAADYLIGAPGAFGRRGMAVLLTGPASAPLFTIVGDQPNDELGTAVAAAGDVNDDGFDDILVGADQAPTSNNGYARVLSGVCGPIVSYGEPCAGAGGFTPVMLVTGCATPLGVLEVRVKNTLGGTFALILLGIGPGAVPAAGECYLYLSPLLPAVAGPFPMPGTAPGQGQLEFVAEVPPVATGGTVYLQAFCEDHTLPWGYTSTNAIEITLK